MNECLPRLGFIERSAVVGSSLENLIDGKAMPTLSCRASGDTSPGRLPKGLRAYHRRTLVNTARFAGGIQGKESFLGVTAGEVGVGVSGRKFSPGIILPGNGRNGTVLEKLSGPDNPTPAFVKPFGMRTPFRCLLVTNLWTVVQGLQTASNFAEL